MSKSTNQLGSELDEKRQEVTSDRLSMSIGELAGLYERSELDIHPKFQRVLRWTEEQKTRLIESLLLRIPIPPIFVAQDREGFWDVVDGVQRLGTIFEFLGILKDSEDDEVPPLRLLAGRILPSLDQMVFDNPHEPQNSFTRPQRLDFRRLRLDLNVILKESDPSTKYELFERLNSGGSHASAQEVRNCVLVWIDETFFDWFKTLGDLEAFRDASPISERMEKSQYRLELVLRFLLLANIDAGDLPGIVDLGDFLTAGSRELAANASYDRTAAETRFNSTFTLICTCLQEDAFRRFDGTAFKGAFLISAFEAVALGVAHNIDAWLREPDPGPKLSAKVKAMWGNPSFTGHIGIGVNARRRLQNTIPFGRTHFVP